MQGDAEGALHGQAVRVEDAQRRAAVAVVEAPPVVGNPPALGIDALCAGKCQGGGGVDPDLPGAPGQLIDALAEARNALSEQFIGQRHLTAQVHGGEGVFAQSGRAVAARAQVQRVADDLQALDKAVRGQRPLVHDPVGVAKHRGWRRGRWGGWQGGCRGGWQGACWGAGRGGCWNACQGGCWGAGRGEGPRVGLAVAPEQAQRQRGDPREPGSPARRCRAGGARRGRGCPCRVPSAGRRAGRVHRARLQAAAPRTIARRVKRAGASARRSAAGTGGASPQISLASTSAPKAA